MTDKELDAIEQRAAAATEGPWDVWDGPAYCGGGHDLCIGAGKEWLANMEYYQGLDYAQRVAHDSALGTEGRHPTDCTICSMSDRVDAQQAADARFIAAARTDIPRLVAEVRRLRALPDGGRSDG